MVKDSGESHGGSGSATLSHHLLTCTRGLEALITEASEINPTLAPVEVKREALMTLSRIIDRAESLRMGVIAAASDVKDAEAARSVADWLAAHTHTDRGPQSAAENLAHDLDRLYPVLAAALTRGAANLAQVRVIAKCLNELRRLAGVTAEILAKAETTLTAECSALAPRELRILGDRILEVIDPDAFEEAERKKLERDLAKARTASRLSMRRRGDGSTDVHARIPDSHAARLKTVLESFTAPRHDSTSNDEAGVHQQGSRFRDAATGERLPQDRMLGEAFCAFLERHDPRLLPKHGGMATTLVITTQYDALTKQLSNGTLPDGSRIPAGDVRRLACNAGIIPAVLGGDSVPLDLGRKKRLFSTDQRVALGLHYRTCQASGCTIPSTWCEAHHRVPWSHGGPTDLDHAMLLCAFHHQRVHDDSYLTKHLPNGDVRFHRRR